MILLTGPTGHGQVGIVAILGTGLIGAATVEALSRRTSFRLGKLPLDWNEQVLQQQQLVAIRETIAGEAAAAVAGGRRPVLDVLWSAGLAGFAASDQQTSRELVNFNAAFCLLPMMRVLIGLEITTRAPETTWCTATPSSCTPGW